MCKNKIFDESVIAQQIASSATITGQSYITGKNTKIGDGVTIENSYLENIVLEDGATVIDSVLVFEQENDKQNDTGCTSIGKASVIRASLLQNTSVGAGSEIDTSALVGSVIGDTNHISELYGKGIKTLHDVTVQGPTESTGSELAYGMHIDQCGYYNGAYSNEFHIFKFNKEKGIIEINETLSVPHVSRYGMNIIDSGNSGNVCDQEDGVLKTIGPYVGLWHNILLRGSSIDHSPLCSVGAWTKVVGKSALSHPTTASKIEDSLATYLMPFSMAGLNGDSVMGQVIIGEQNNSYNYKKRLPAWTFTYAPDVVIKMVKRLHEYGVESQITDNIVKHSLKNALALLEMYAYNRNIDLEKASTLKHGKGWKGWLTKAKEIYEYHLNSGLWEFKNGEPVAWQFRDNKWRTDKESDLLKIAPDAIENQTSEEAILLCSEPKLEKTLGVSVEALTPTHEPAQISAEAQVSPSAWIGPGVQILGKSIIKDNVKLFRTVVKDSTIEDGASFYRSVIDKSQIGQNVVGKCSLVQSSNIGNDSMITSASIDRSKISDRSVIYPFAHVENATITNPCIIGTTVKNTDVNSFLMTYHMPGYAEHLRVDPLEMTFNGKTHQLMIIPMLGGGMRILGEKDKKVSVSCSFVGSNAIVEAGAYVGFGSFLLGRLTGEEGLLPFTLSTQPGPERDQIGGVASNFPHIIITHFIQWTFHANGPEKADIVARMVPYMLNVGKKAVLAELTRRETNQSGYDDASYEKYKSLKLYSLDQLKSGLASYENELADGRWEMGYIDGELKFTGNGLWNVNDGSARWKSAEA